MWRELIDEKYPGCAFFPVASEQDLATAEALLQRSLPEDLRSFLLESNGLVSPRGNKIIWSAKEIQAENEFIRQLSPYHQFSCMPFDDLVFFSGNLFGNDEPTLAQFGLAYGLAKSGDYIGIYGWAEDDSRIRIAGGVEDYLASTMTGELQEWWLEETYYPKTTESDVTASDPMP